MKHYKYNRLTAHLMVDCFLLIRFEFQLTVSSFLSCFSKRVYNFFYSVLLLFVFLLAFVSFSNIKLKRKFFFLPFVIAMMVYVPFIVASTSLG